MAVTIPELMNMTPSEINEVFNRPPLEMTKSDIRTIIEYSLYFQAKVEAGMNPKKLHEQAEHLEVKPITPRPVMKRRI